MSGTHQPETGVSTTDLSRRKPDGAEHPLSLLEGYRRTLQNAVRVGWEFIFGERNGLLPCIINVFFARLRMLDSPTRSDVSTLVSHRVKKRRRTSAMRLFLDCLYCVSSHQAPYRPFDHIPNELLVTIFRFVVLLSAQTCTPDVRSKIPARVSAVSTRWRSIAATVPEMWSFVWLPNPTLPTTSAYVKLFRERSTNVPMHFDVSAHNPTEVLDMDFVLRENLDRISRLTVRTSNHFPTCLTALKPLPSSLEEVRLISLNWVREMRIRLLAPNLHTLQCIGIVPIVPAGELQSLRSMTLRDLNVLRITRLSLILSRWMNIHHLHLRRWTLEPEEPDYDVPLRFMPRLKTLKFEKMGQDALRGTLALILAPKLESLYIEDVEDPLGGWLDPSWSGVQFREMEGLGRLSLIKFHKKDGPCTLESILRVAPNLHHLTIVEEDPACFNMITKPDLPPMDVPRIQTLEIDAAGPPSESALMFMKLISGTLRKLCVPERWIEPLKETMASSPNVQICGLHKEVVWGSDRVC